jgi:hypothetical protein
MIVRCAGLMVYRLDRIGKIVGGRVDHRVQAAIEPLAMRQEPPLRERHLRWSSAANNWQVLRRRSIVVRRDGFVNVGDTKTRLNDLDITVYVVVSAHKHPLVSVKDPENA